MVKVRTLAPLTHPTTGEQLAAGAEVDVADEVASDWKADGKIAFVADEQAAAKQAAEGNYTARTGRDEAGGKDADEPPPPRAKKN